MHLIKGQAEFTRFTKYTANRYFHVVRIPSGRVTIENLVNLDEYTLATFRKVKKDAAEAIRIADKLAADWIPGVKSAETGAQ